LVIGGTLFPHKMCHKVTWVSLDLRTENQTDHILVSRKWRLSYDVRNKRGADIGSDHHTIVANFKMKICAAKKFETKNKPFYVNKLQDTAIQEKFKLELKNQYQVLNSLIAQEDGEQEVGEMKESE
jgi:hypothetical protein